MGIIEKIGEREVSILILSSARYGDQLLHVMKNLGEKNVCYVTVNKPAETVKKELGRKSIGLDEYCFIDATGAGSAKGEKSERCIAFDSLTDLVQFGICIGDLVKKQQPKVLVFDSVTTLTIYNDEMNVLKFAHNLSTKMRGTGCRLVFPCLNTNNALIKDVGLFADEVIDFEMNKIGEA